MKTHVTPSLSFSIANYRGKQEALWQHCVDVCVYVLWPHPDSVGLSQPYRIGQLDLDLSTVEGSKHTHHLQQTVIQPAGKPVVAMPIWIVEDFQSIKEYN